MVNTNIIGAPKCEIILRQSLIGNISPSLSKEYILKIRKLLEYKAQYLLVAMSKLAKQTRTKIAHKNISQGYHKETIFHFLNSQNLFTNFKKVTFREEKS